MEMEEGKLAIEDKLEIIDGKIISCARGSTTFWAGRSICSIMIGQKWSRTNVSYPFRFRHHLQLVAPRIFISMHQIPVFSVKIREQ
ncbi:hypothetical protein BLGI_4262 [Brevibacillus laterosporus GI-9]|nr:hypothetical protein BLGI_4262 [Brevibacillus laterosporus GI-9]